MRAVVAERPLRSVRREHPRVGNAASRREARLPTDEPTALAFFRRIGASPRGLSKMRVVVPPKRIDGYKRHIVTDLDSGLILACALTPANRPEAEAVPSLEQDLAAQGLTVDELQVDQAYVNSSLAQAVRARGGLVLCRPRASAPG